MEGAAHLGRKGSGQKEPPFHPQIANHGSVFLMLLTYQRINWRNLF